MSQNIPVIQEATATGESISAIISEIEPILYQLKASRSQAVIALLALAITLQNPYISAEDVQEGVKGASEWICLFVSGKDTDAVAEPLVLN